MATSKYSRYYTYIKPVITNPTVKSAAPYIFSIITITIFTIFVIRPTIATILELQKNIEESRKTLQALDKKTQDLTQAKQNLENMDPEIWAGIENALPQQTSVPSLIANLQTAAGGQASASALQIQPLTIFDNKTPKTHSTLGEVDFSFNIQGSYPELLVTLNNLQNSPRLLSIRAVSITKQPDTPGLLSVTGKAFFLK
ncbi:MAG: type 4a pilus biogenesis protein PilO [bacterium]|nr:type 4a pilus biogenesis protein PilO [bacterium]